MARPGSPRGTSPDRSRRRMATLIIVVGVVVLVGWIAAVTALAGGSGGSPQGGAEDSISDSAGQDEQAASANASAEPTTGEDGEDDQGDSSGDGQGEGGQPDQSRQAVSGEAETGAVFGPLEEEDHSQNGSTGSGEGQTAGTGITRARAASEDFITAAYGYSGESEDDYLEGIEQAATEAIYDSPGGAMLEGYSQAAPECGMRSTAILEEFQVIGQSPEGLDAAVTFSVEDGPSDSSDGQTHTFSQDQRLTTSGDSYEVSGVSMEELISDTTPRESCPGGQSQGSSSGGAEQKEIKPSGTSVADEDRAKAAAGRYITSAYGYTGDSSTEYRDGISRTADTNALYKSPGGERIREYARAAGEDGITAAAVMESFEITSTNGGVVKGTAYFKVGREYGRYGKITGETTPFEVDLTLSPVRSTYEVSASSLEREVSGESGAGPAKKTK